VSFREERFEGEHFKFTTQPGRVPPEVTFIHLK
jgi:hypothetical protein